MKNILFFLMLISIPNIALCNNPLVINYTIEKWGGFWKKTNSATIDKKIDEYPNVAQNRALFNKQNFPILFDSQNDEVGNNMELSWKAQQYRNKLVHSNLLDDIEKFLSNQKEIKISSSADNENDEQRENDIFKLVNKQKTPFSKEKNINDSLSRIASKIAIALDNNSSIKKIDITMNENVASKSWFSWSKTAIFSALGLAAYWSYKNYFGKQTIGSIINSWLPAAWHSRQ